MDGDKFNTQGGYPHPNPPPAYSDPQPYPSMAPPAVTVIHQPGHGGTTYVAGGGATVVVPMRLGTEPMRTKCNSCGADIVTRITTKPTVRTHLIAAILCFTGLWPCVCIPYCVDSCMASEHYCPNCNVYLGSSYR